MIEPAIFIIFPLCMAITAFSDLLSMTIPNRVSIILCAAFLLLAPFAGLGLEAIAWHMLGALIVFLVGFALFAARVMGGGDAKVLAASALWFGFGPDLFAYLIHVTLIGGALTLIFLMIRARGDLLLATGLPIPAHVLDRKAGIPYGVGIGIAGFVCFPSSVMMQTVFGWH